MFIRKRGWTTSIPSEQNFNVPVILNLSLNPSLLTCFCVPPLYSRGKSLSHRIWRTKFPIFQRHLLLRRTYFWFFLRVSKYLKIVIYPSTLLPSLRFILPPMMKHSEIGNLTKNNSSLRKHDRSFSFII